LVSKRKPMEQIIPKIFDEAQDFMPINGTDYIEIYLPQSQIDLK